MRMREDREEREEDARNERERGPRVGESTSKEEEEEGSCEFVPGHSCIRTMLRRTELRNGKDRDRLEWLLRLRDFRFLSLSLFTGARFTQPRI